jgi:hypothetical protein
VALRKFVIPVRSGANSRPVRQQANRLTGRVLIWISLLILGFLVIALRAVACPVREAATAADLHVGDPPDESEPALTAVPDEILILDQSVKVNEQSALVDGLNVGLVKPRRHQGYELVLLDILRRTATPHHTDRLANMGLRKD